MKGFFRKIKDYCIKDTTRTILLVAILVALYIVLNLWMQTINLAQIDLTKDRLYTLTDQSKNIAKTIDKEMTFYVWGYTEDSSVIDLLKQYNAENSKINYKIVKTDDIENKEKYGFEDNYPSIIGEASDGRTSYINDSDLYSYDANYNVVDLTEQKLTNAINNLSITEKTKVYFLEGKTNYTTASGLYYLSAALGQEYYDIKSLNMVSDPTIPEDCDVLALMGLTSDLTEQEANNICQYIEKGGDMIISLDVDYTNAERNYPNFQRVLDEYAVSMPNKVVQEASSNTVAGFENIVIQAEVASDHEITRLMYNYDTNMNSGYSVKPILVASGIIELDTEKMSGTNTTATPIMMTSNSAKVANIATKAIEDNDGSYYVLGAAVQKMVESGDESRAVIFAAASSFSDNTIDGVNPMFAYNSNVIMNSFAFSSNRGELYSIRKSSKYTQYTPTERQEDIVKIIIYVVPAVIVVVGACVWVRRRRRK